MPSGAAAHSEESVYNPAPAQSPKPTEDKKTKFDAAEYDESFLERMAEMGYEDFMAYLQSLPDDQRKATEAALSTAVSLQAMKCHHQWLRGGLEE